MDSASEHVGGPEVSMKHHHAAFGLPLEGLDAVIVEDSRQMQAILRSVLLSFKVERVRVFDTVDSALEAMLSEPPNLILADWKMEPSSGYQLLRLIRHKNMAPLCFVPLLFVTAHGTRALVDKALRAGAHHLLVKPVSPSLLFSRLRWLLNDDREFVLDKHGFYTIDGVGELLDAQAGKMQTLDSARAYHERATRRYQEALEAVEQVFSGDDQQQTEPSILRNQVRAHSVRPPVAAPKATPPNADMSAQATPPVKRTADKTETPAAKRLKLAKAQAYAALTQSKSQAKA